jgi:hypothetical protein
MTLGRGDDQRVARRAEIGRCAQSISAPAAPPERGAEIAEHLALDAVEHPRRGGAWRSGERR